MEGQPTRSAGSTVCWIAGTAFVCLWPAWTWVGLRQIAFRRQWALAHQEAVQALAGNIGAALIVLSPLAAFFLAWLTIGRANSTSRRRLLLLVALFLGALGSFVGCCLVDMGFPYRP